MRQSPMIAAACGLLAAASPAIAQKQTAPAPVVAVIDSAVARLFSLGASTGVGIVVVRDTQIIYAKGLGYADAEAKRPVTPTTGFYIASTTKSFMGLAVAMLDLQGKVKLDAPVSRYLPTMKLREPMSPDSITMRSLLTHTHGIGDGPVAIRLAFTGEYKDDAELVGLMAEHVPNPRGRSYAYTNLGYNVAALATDEVLHESWKKTLERMLFTPLGMKQTSAFVSGRAA
jgi:CubicO group peptidase (beta-lactamase class C family)